MGVMVWQLAQLFSTRFLPGPVGGKILSMSSLGDRPAGAWAITAPMAKPIMAAANSRVSLPPHMPRVVFIGTPVSCRSFCLKRRARGHSCHFWRQIWLGLAVAEIFREVAEQRGKLFVAHPSNPFLVIAP